MNSVNFDRAADFYDATRGFPDRIAEKVGEFIAKETHLSENSKILEVGIGTGRIALPLAPYVRLISGVDISPKMMQVLLQKRDNEAVFPVQADGHQLPYAENVFDTAMIVHVLHLVPEPVAILKDVQRVLKPQGKLLHCFNQRDMDKHPLAEAWSKNRPQRRFGHNYESTENALAESGWELEQDHLFTYSFMQTAHEFLYPFENRAWSSTWDVSDAELAIGIEAIKQAIDEHYAGDYDAQFERQGGFQIQVLRPIQS